MHHPIVAEHGDLELALYSSFLPVPDRPRFAEAPRPLATTTTTTTTTRTATHTATTTRTSTGPRPGRFEERDLARERDFAARDFTVGIGGPVSSGKTALLLALCRRLRDTLRLGVVTNDIFTREDAEFLTRHEALPRRTSAPSRPAAARTPRSARTSART